MLNAPHPQAENIKLYYNIKIIMEIFQKLLFSFNLAYDNFTRFSEL